MRKAALAALALLALGGTAPVSTLEVEITDLRSTRGLLLVCVTAAPANFPACKDDAHAVKRRVPASEVLVTFPGLPRGAYALAVIHDENANKRLDTFAGMPREGFGFSRNPVIRFGPPRFGDARFTLGGGASRQQVRMRYML